MLILASLPNFVGAPSPRKSLMPGKLSYLGCPCDLLGQAICEKFWTLSPLRRQCISQEILDTRAGCQQRRRCMLHLMRVCVLPCADVFQEMRKNLKTRAP